MSALRLCRTILLVAGLSLSMAGQANPVHIDEDQTTYSEELTGRAGFDAALILGHREHSWLHPITNACEISFAPFPCYFFNKGKVFSGGAYSAITVDSGSTWSITNFENGVFSTSEDGNAQAVAFNLNSGIGNVLLKNYGLITAMPSNGTAVAVHNRSSYYSNLGSGLRWENHRVVEGRVAFHIDTSSVFELINTGTINGDIHVSEDDNEDALLLRGNSQFIGHLTGVEKLTLNSTETEKGENLDNEITWSGRVTIPSTGGEQPIRVSDKTAIVTSGLIIDNGVLSFGKGVRIKINALQEHVDNIQNPVIQSGGHILFAGKAFFYIDPQGLDLQEDVKITVLSADTLKIEALNIGVITDKGYRAELVRLTNRELVVAFGKE
ncbi:hypothetical protein [Sansalvadorimonas verongulae]|uniref:hypothetical protein n=1 Tax=Sansalvadorimonas verongulae TaxID=2172824 RepID=UPI0012BC17C6|nr:hypothetical protein [Sansalvadorimonas verongulae]MTI12587.1 hypothetical protein [Sansalvadorimonas verongulae]